MGTAALVRCQLLLEDCNWSRHLFSRVPAVRAASHTLVDKTGAVQHGLEFLCELVFGTYIQGPVKHTCNVQFMFARLPFQTILPTSTVLSNQTLSSPGSSLPVPAASLLLPGSAALLLSVVRPPLLVLLLLCCTSLLLLLLRWASAG